MSPLQIDGLHEMYTRTPRHWCPGSEPYTGADSLITAIDSGWKVSGRVFRENILLGRSRHTTVYHFRLRRNGKEAVMPVIETPFVIRLLHSYRFQVILEQQSEQPTTLQQSIAAAVAV